MTNNERESPISSHSLEVIFDNGFPGAPAWKVVCECGWECWDQVSEIAARSQHGTHVENAEEAESAPKSLYHEANVEQNVLALAWDVFKPGYRPLWRFLHADIKTAFREAVQSAVNEVERDV